MVKKLSNSLVGEWRKYYRFIRILIFTTRLFLASGLFLILAFLLSRLTGIQSITVLVQILNANTNLAIALLAFVTTFATVIYVQLTRSILIEMVETRRADIRPFIRLTFQNPLFRTDGQHEAPLLFVEFAIKMSNHGRGCAVGIRTHITVPHTMDENGKPKEWVGTDVDWDGSTALEASEELAGHASVFMPPYDLPKRGCEFLELEARYEDAHQGLYCLKQYYDLFDYGTSEQKFKLTLKYEALYHFPFARRRSIRDTDMRLALTWGETPVYERRIPWPE